MKEEEKAQEKPEQGMAAMPVQSIKEAGLPEYRELSPEEKLHYRGILEAIIFLSPEPVSLTLLARRCDLDRVNVRSLLDSLIDDYESREGGLTLQEIAGGYQFITSERYSNTLEALFKEQKRETLSRGALETLAIICYRQPITLPEIEDIRGVSSRAMLSILLQRKLIKPQGHRLVPGRPTLYVTTRSFLAHFALGSLNDLPVLKDVKELEFDSLE